MSRPDVMVISNMEFGDMTFTSDVGSWNVTRAVRDCLAGKHRAHLFEVAEALQNNAAIEVDAAKVDAMVADPERLGAAPPLIFAQENGRIWLIDGHHRLRAWARLGAREFAAFVIEDEDAAPYRIYFNGSRIAPWMEQTS